MICFKLDLVIFLMILFNYEILLECLRELVFFLKGMLIELIDEWVGMVEVFYFEEGVKNFVEYINEGKDVFYFVVSFEGENVIIEVEMVF